MAKRYIYFVDKNQNYFINTKTDYYISSQFEEIINNFQYHKTYIYKEGIGYQTYVPYIKLPNGEFKKVKSYLYLGIDE